MHRLFAELFWVDFCWHRIDVGELCFENLDVKSFRENLHDYVVAKSVAVVVLHILRVNFEWNTEIC